MSLLLLFRPSSGAAPADAPRSRQKVILARHTRRAGGQAFVAGSINEVVVLWVRPQIVVIQGRHRSPQPQKGRVCAINRARFAPATVTPLSPFRRPIRVRTVRIPPTRIRSQSWRYAKPPRLETASGWCTGGIGNVPAFGTIEVVTATGSLEVVGSSGSIRG